MAKTIYNKPGLTISEIETLVANSVGWDTGVPAELTKIDQLITVAGQAAATWNGAGWWWSQGRAQFNTAVWTIAATASSGAQRSSNVATITTTAAHGLIVGQYVVVSCTSDPTFDGTFRVASVPSSTTFTYGNVGDDVGAATAGGGTVSVLSYPLPYVNIAGAYADTGRVMEDVYAIQQITVNDDYQLGVLSDKNAVLEYVDQFESTHEPTQYAVSQELYTYDSTSEYLLTLWLVPPPDASTDTLKINYLRRHSKITNAESLDGALMVPGEFHMGVYVAGATWLARQEFQGVASLYECPQFRATMGAMAMADPSGDYDQGAEYKYPPDQRVFISPKTDLSID